ncbi:MAG: hypothetical protein LBG61_05755 [Burkholderiales bacterium]|jgi:hypothetical protein|nr:hypothetical protein [Burkholderiales bacterium]
MNTPCIRLNVTEALTDELPIGDLALSPERVLGKPAMNSTLHFCSPAHGGWGVIRVACLLPETHLLFVCPEACGRHGAIAAVEQGYRHKITYLCVDEHEIVLGGYSEEIARAVDDLMIRVTPSPKAILLFLPCIDDLLAGDHSAIMAALEQKHRVPIRLTRMNPIMTDNKMTPMLQVQKALYEFLPPASSAPKNKNIIALGAFSPPQADSELASLIRFLGFDHLCHPEFCKDFESFTALSKSAAALLLRPEGVAAAQFLNDERNIPSLYAPIAYDQKTLLARYQEIIDFLTPLSDAGTSAPIKAHDYFALAVQKTTEALHKTSILLKGMSVAVDQTVTASPFSLALALVQGGVNVNRIYANYLPTHEEYAFRALSAQKKDLIVANPNHHKKFGARPVSPLSQVAIGFEAAYATAAPITVPLAFDEKRYGFEGFQMILDAVCQAIAQNQHSTLYQNLREQIKEYGLVV